MIVTIFRILLSEMNLETRRFHFNCWERAKEGGHFGWHSQHQKEREENLAPEEDQLKQGVELVDLIELKSVQVQVLPNWMGLNLVLMELKLGLQELKLGLQELKMGMQELKLGLQELNKVRNKEQNKVPELYNVQELYKV
jgi:hypothetical protein